MTTHRFTLRTAQTILMFTLALIALPSLHPVSASTHDTDAATATITLTPAADSSITQQFPANNTGNAAILRVVSPALTDFEVSSLLRFDLSGIPAGAIITKAELHLYQQAPADTPWTINIERVLSPWQEDTVTWDTQPDTTLVYSGLSVPAGADQRVAFDVTTLVQGWVHTPNPLTNFGLLLAPGDAPNRRDFASAETDTPPELQIEYTPPPSLVTVPQSANAPKEDGICSPADYSGASVYQYGDVDGSVQSIYLFHTSDALYVCVTGARTINLFPGRFFGLYLDTDRSQDEDGSQVPNADDFSLRITVADPIASTLRGTGEPAEPYTPGEFGSWQAFVFSDPETGVDSAEFSIPFATLHAAIPSCGATIGLGIYHQSVRDSGDDAGWPLLDANSGPNRPDSWIPLQLANPICPIRVCVEDGTTCEPPGANALVYRAGDGQMFSVDAAGFVENRAAIAAGDQLWALYPHETQDRFTVYLTNGAPQTVNTAAFQATPPGVMTLVVDDQYPLVLHELEVSTQWTLTPEERGDLAQQIVKASDFLYDFTDGQFALGQVTVHQNYDAWEEADLWTYANNNMRPKATAGGVVETELPDPDNDLSYFPGYIHMGRYWNRYHAPEGQPITFDGQPVDLSTLEDDWAIALAHEIGHYGLFLFDTYFGIGPDESVVSVYSCTGSAMGWVYDAENWGYVYDPVFWDANCARTHANQLLARDEWATIRLHYPWLNTPASFVPGPTTPPVPLTQVNFVDPADPGTPLANPLYDLLYANGETASRKALSYLFRDGRVISQGNVVKGTTQIELAGAQADDRFCVYDIDARPPAPDTPRHQYGCETLEDGDNQLQMERDPSWRPIVLIDPTGPTSIAISVTQPLGNNASLVATVYPEHLSSPTTIPLVRNGRVHTGSADLSEAFPITEARLSIPSAYVQVYVDENGEELNPRREAMAMYGVDGGTVPGPSSWDQKAPVYSSDGNSMAWPIESVRVEPGQWVSMQYMVETYPDPSGSTRLSDAYRVISWPPEIAQKIVVSVMVDPPEEPLQAASVNPAATQQASRVIIRYWTGSDWRAVPTNVLPGQDGKLVASAILPANVIYAVFNGPLNNYLPTTFKTVAR